MTGAARLVSLKVQGTERPLAMDDPRPRFSWVLEPGDHDVTILTTRVVVQDAAGATVWESGDLPPGVVSARPADDIGWASFTAYDWRVHLDSHVDGREESLAAASTFETGPLDAGAWAPSSWIAGTPGAATTAAPLLRGIAAVPGAFVRARLVVAAGGIASVSVNGSPMDEVLSPGLTNFSERVPFVVHDVTAMLRTGTNVIAASLGRGFFGMTTENTWNWHRAPWHDEPCLRMLLVVDLADGTTVRFGTGPTFLTSRGGTRADSYYEGEVFDARLEPDGWRELDFDDAQWSVAASVEGSGGTLRARPFPGIRVVESVEPASIDARGDGRFVLDFGRQVAGWLRIDVPATEDSGCETTLLSAERLVDGEPVIDTPFSAGDFQLDRVTGAGEAFVWEPSFSYKGFQYVEVRGWPAAELAPDAVVAKVAHTDLDRTAGFACSDPLLTWMHQAAVATIQNNLHHVPTDTPAYEKNGWTGDAALGADMMLRDLDSAALLEDWLETVSDSRNTDGRPPLIAPNPDWVWPEHMSAPPWHAAYTMIPWRIYWATGDDRVLRRHAEGIFKYVRLEHSLAHDGLSDTGLGDYLPPDKRGNPDEDLRVCATIAVHDSTMVAARIATIVGDDGAEREFTARAALIRAAFRREFYDDVHGVVRDGIAGYRQTHNVLALDSHMLAPELETRLAANLAADIDDHRNGHLWVGALGVRRALPVLDLHGHTDTAFRAATATDFPSWGAWREAGATTMWEYWDDQRSRNHYFFGTVDDWLFEHVAGVRPTAPGYGVITVRPDHLRHLGQAAAWIETVRGRLEIEWERGSSDGVCRVRLPHGTDARIELPGQPPQHVQGRRELRFTVDDRRSA